MKRLILDHLRRWFWVLALVGALEFGLGWSIAKQPQSDFEFLGLLLAMWAGAVLLSFNLRRGFVRSIAVLPLKGTQIGRGWWLATVCIPAIALAALLFFGAGIFCYFHPDKVFPAGRLGMAGLFNVAWLGTMFTLVFPTPLVHRKPWENVRAFLISVMSQIMLFGGMLFCQSASKSPLKSLILLGGGALLTAVGWFRAEHFVLGRTNFRLAMPRHRAALQPAAQTGRRHAPSGFGGIPFLMRTIFVRTFLILVAMVAVMALMMAWRGMGMPRQQAIIVFASMGSFMSCFFIFILQPMLLLRHLRFLRTLPVSANRLAGVMIGAGILPLMALGALVTGVAGLLFGTPAAITFLESYAFILAPASLCVFFAVWLGAGTWTYALMLLTMFGFQLGPLWFQRILLNPEIPGIQSGAFVALCVLLAFLFTRRALLRSSHAFRVQASPSCNLPWATVG